MAEAQQAASSRGFKDWFFEFLHQNLRYEHLNPLCFFVQMGGDYLPTIKNLMYFCIHRWVETINYCKQQ